MKQHVAFTWTKRELAKTSPRSQTMCGPTRGARRIGSGEAWSGYSKTANRPSSHLRRKSTLTTKGRRQCGSYRTLMAFIWDTERVGGSMVRTAVLTWSLPANEAVLDLPKTFNTWAIVCFLHMWILQVRIR